MKTYLLTKSNEITIIVGETIFGYETVNASDCVKAVYVDTQGNELIPHVGDEHLYAMIIKDIRPKDVLLRRFITYQNVKVVDTNYQIILSYKGKEN